MRKFLAMLGGVIGLTFGPFQAGAQISVVSTAPSRHTAAPLTTSISVTFDRPVDRATITPHSFWAFGRWSGPADGAFEFSSGDQTVTIRPARRFTVGEPVTVTIADSVRGADGSSFRAQGYQYQFMTHARRGRMTFTQIDSITTNLVPSDFTRIYGAAGSDVNLDGFLDLVVVNEVSADIRVFLNRADGTGLYHPFLQPPTANEIEASPNEPSDFNRDGQIDLATANTTGSTASIHLGIGNGTFAPRQVVAVGSAPHGLAVLDVDGDGDIDIATSNTSGNNVSVMLNSGNGVFGAATSFDAGCSGEYALGAADMNEDGIMDLVVGCITSQTVRVLRGNGNGTFTGLTPAAAGGNVWMLAVGDVNGDGHIDVATSNSGSGNGGILLGNGAGGLLPAVTYAIPGTAIATDLGDFDGDGDLDWVMSSFSGSRWRLYRNNGNGTFGFVQDWTADANPSCAVILDFDNDRDLDLVFTDEIEDTIRLMRNDSFCPGDFNGDGMTDVPDIFGFLAAWFGGQWQADWNESGTTDVPDIFAFLSDWFSLCP